jgi:hypothetical protein
MEKPARLTFIILMYLDMFMEVTGWISGLKASYFGHATSSLEEAIFAALDMSFNPWRPGDIVLRNSLLIPSFACYDTHAVGQHYGTF